MLGTCLAIAGVMTVIIGVAGFGGSLDLDTSPVISLYIIAAGILLTLWGKIEGGFDEEGNDPDVDALLDAHRKHSKRRRDHMGKK